MEERITLCRKCYDDNFKGVENAIRLSLDIIKCSMCEECSHAMLSINEAIYKNTMENKEITLKMSLETARQMYKTAKETQGAGNPTEMFLLKNFTREELEESQGYTWEKSFLPGYKLEDSNVCQNVIVKKCSNPIPHRNFQFQFRTEKQALSALAFAQLSHIVAHANSKSAHSELNNKLTFYYINKFTGGVLSVEKCSFYRIHPTQSFYFIREQDAKNSLIKNRELWEQYFDGFGVI